MDVADDATRPEKPPVVLLAERVAKLPFERHLKSEWERLPVDFKFEIDANVALPVASTLSHYPRAGRLASSDRQRL